MRRAMYKERQNAPLFPCEFHFIRPEVYDDPEGRTDISQAYREYVWEIKRDEILLYECRE